MRQEFTVSVPSSLVVSSNRTAPVWHRKKLKDWWAQAVPELAPMGRANVWVGITKRTRGRYDPANLTDTFKGCVDALVRAGVLDEDDYSHVNGPWLFHEGVDRLVPSGVVRARVILVPFGRVEEVDCESRVGESLRLLVEAREVP